MLFIAKAAADKLKHELEEFGFPPKFPMDINDEVEVEKVTIRKEIDNSNVDNKSKSKKAHFFHNVEKFHNIFLNFYSNRVKQ